MQRNPAPATTGGDFFTSGDDAPVFDDVSGVVVFVSVTVAVLGDGVLLPDCADVEAPSLLAAGACRLRTTTLPDRMLFCEGRVESFGCAGLFLLAISAWSFCAHGRTSKGNTID